MALMVHFTPRVGMPYELTWESAGVVHRFSGVVTDEELIAATREVNADDRLADVRYQIVDFSTIQTFDVSSAAVRRVAALDLVASITNPDVKVAIITLGAFVRGMSNMYRLGHEAGGGSWATRVFEAEDEARAWAMS